jgi:hypothetical protein
VSDGGRLPGLQLGAGHEHPRISVHPIPIKMKKNNLISIGRPYNLRNRTAFMFQYKYKILKKTFSIEMSLIWETTRSELRIML